MSWHSNRKPSVQDISPDRIMQFSTSLLAVVNTILVMHGNFETFCSFAQFDAGSELDINRHTAESVIVQADTGSCKKAL